MKRHFARYTPELVEQACGVSRDTFLKVAEAFTSASWPNRTAAICHAGGWTQHSKGVQIIRCAAILQSLLGNIGRPGGGILAVPAAVADIRLQINAAKLCPHQRSCRASFEASRDFAMLAHVRGKNHEDTSGALPPNPGSGAPSTNFT
jgi:anaerobic selenocysteine-containing dehydrogenase